MCGKFTQKLDSRLEALADALGDSPVETVTPVRFADVVTLDREGARKFVRMRWGLVPRDAPDVRDTKPHIHARAESIDVKPTFREAFAKRRGLIFVSSFNEGQEISPTKTTQYVLTSTDDRPIAIAVIWNYWRKEGEPSLLNFAMVTTPANELIGTITDRMPALVEMDDWPKWLGEIPASPEELKGLLRPSTRELKMQAAATKSPPPAKPKRDNAQADLF